MMNSKIEKEFEDFIITGRESIIIEKALYYLLDKYKNELIRGRLSMGENTDKIIYECLDKINLHNNYKKNKRFFEVNIKSDSENGEKHRVA